ncbi:hypothetical protein GAZ68_13640 [Phocaeicola vulgatus]|nr:hypothetical protein GAZ68_13640 [Phocaeicola vulgatus]
MNKFCCLLSSIVLLILFNCCNMRVDKFKPETYFSRTDYLEFSMAKAIYHENKKQIKENVSSGKVDINKPGVSGFTYLLYAIFLERYDIVKVLLELGADPNQLSIIKHPDGSIEKLTPLGCVCRNHWYPIKYIKLLVEKGANVNDTNITPLHACVGNPGKDQKRVRYLIENGANINQVFGDYTPMQRAVLGRRLDLVDLLWDYGANPLYIGKKGNSLAYMVQNIVNKNLGTPKYVNHAREIMERLKELGVQFPVSLNPTKNVEEKTDSTTTDPCQNQTDTNKVEWNWM